ncbi:MAG TPA: Gldg family protein [Candidatus Acidoferrales bacterium]|nr:Gldg family protein [Candidatus Acidoferrales bacterium]
MRRSNSLLGLIGLILILFAGVAGIFTRGQTTVDQIYIAVNGLFGVFALIAYLSAGLESIREVVSDRSTKYGANVLVGSAVFLAVLVILNYLSARHSHRFDLTEQGVYSLSPQSINVVKALDKELKVDAFVEGGLNPELHDLLDTFALHSPNFKYQLVDPDKQPELAEKYQIKSYNTVHLEYDKEQTTITQPTEENLTNAIIKVTRSTKKVVCFIEGHGEPDTDDSQGPKGLGSFKLALTNENYEVKKVLLASMASVPADCSVVVVASPERPYQDSELNALGSYMDGGGHALFLIAPREGAQFEPFLAKWGVKLGNDVVVDQVLRLFQGPALGLSPLVNTYGTHDITREFKQRTIFPMTRSVKSDTSGKNGLQAVELVKTSPSSWAETDLDGLFQRSEATLDANTDSKGPVSIAVAVDANLKQMGKEKDGSARLVAFGSVEFVANREFEGTYYNRDLAMNSVGWLVGQADLVSIRPRAIRSSRAQFSPEQFTVIFYLSVLLIPQILLLAGLAVWWRRE